MRPNLVPIGYSIRLGQFIIRSWHVLQQCFHRMCSSPEKSTYVFLLWAWRDGHLYYSSSRTDFLFFSPLPFCKLLFSYISIFTFETFIAEESRSTSLRDIGKIGKRISLQFNPSSDQKRFHPNEWQQSIIEDWKIEHLFKRGKEFRQRSKSKREEAELHSPTEEDETLGTKQFETIRQVSRMEEKIERKRIARTQPPSSQGLVRLNADLDHLLKSVEDHRLF